MPNDTFFRKLDVRVLGLKRKYFDSPVRSSVRMLLWSLREFWRALFRKVLSFMRSVKRQPVLTREDEPVLTREDDKLRICIIFTGGIGDKLMYGLAVKELAKRIDCEYLIEVVSDYAKTAPELKLVFSGWDILTVKEEQPAPNEIYDVVLRADRVILVLHCDHTRVAKKSPWLDFFCQENEKFSRKYFHLVGEPMGVHALLEQWVILKSQKRIQQPDMHGLLGIGDKSHTLLCIKSEDLQFLETLGLKNTQYITIQRGIHHCHNLRNNTRSWPVRHYEEFVGSFRKTFPNVKIVQLGYSREICNSIAGVDINLIGKTSLDQLAVVLKHSLFHLDGDAGMVHMKKFLNGRSIAMFGPTSAEVFGYTGNINITGNGCPSWCEWLTADWNEKCLRGFDEAPCMASITPEVVMEAAKKILGERKKYSCAVADRNIEKSKIADYILSRSTDPKIKIVDIFNENGLTLAMELRKNFDDITVFGSNFKWNSFSKAQKDGLKLEYGCLYNISMPDDSSDVVIWQNSNHSLAATEYILKELLRILKPEGILIISGALFSETELEQFNLNSGSFSLNGKATVITKTLKNC
jgi:hypothetical protein